MSTDVENERLRSQLEAQEPSTHAAGRLENAGGIRGDGRLQRATYHSPVRYPGLSSQNTDMKQSKHALRDLKNWNPPLLGPLPKSFLRLDVHGPGMAAGAVAFSGGGESSPGGPADAELAQFLEDERMAILLQNEEFMRELRRNKDFMSSLDGGQPGGHKGDDSQAHMHDDAAFRFLLYKNTE
ncbi:CUE domain-containing protein 1-like [Tropilaelaps mercedesae]|uniref:CUE domain-containing protein 1-like n=1 Tax=Tropilaelaps mercedesae TaxID=418985 RepID=A0A1V9X101_9ACAR|nr:CUE domain-containing protein 1-like [Tropilaelaps mercedesae]